LFHGVEIVSDKTPLIYGQIAARHGAHAQAMLMVGNSLKSDVLPMIAAGGWGVHVPQGAIWALEHAEPPLDHPRFGCLPDLGGLADFVAQSAYNHHT
jgi:putative hydrolase of the HAD superfamily